jgi:uncharacterized protein
MSMIVSAPSKTTSLPIFDGWQFTPEGAVFHPGEQTAVIADLHLGYEWARGASGDCVIAHSLEETLKRLATLIDRTMASRLIVAGDLLESSRPCPQTVDDVRRLRAWLADRDVSLLVLEGNHDVSSAPSIKRASHRSIPLPLTCTIAGWTIGHGHRSLTGAQRISGHHHPVLRCQGIAAPCFLVGPGRIVLPAFSSNAAGCDVISAAIPKEWLAHPFYCLVSTGCEVLDFGLLTALRRRLLHRAR